jgi:hypothetical protein
VSPYGVQGHYEPASDVRAVQVGSEQPKHVQLAFAQWLDQWAPEGVPILVITEPGEEPRLLPADRTILQFDAEK